MDTNAIRLSTRELPLLPEALPGGTGPAPAPGGDFRASLSEMIGQVNGLHHKAARLTERLVSGEVEEAHQVMIAAEEASVAFELMMEIRNKLLEAYQEIMRMQV